MVSAEKEECSILCACHVKITFMLLVWGVLVSLVLFSQQIFVVASFSYYSFTAALS